MSQNPQSDGGQKHFAVGRGLLAAAENLNFNMNEQRSSRQMGGMASGGGMGGAGIEGQDGGAQMTRRGGSNLGSTMKLFASLGLSPSDLDTLAEIPEEDISVETLPHILMQLKNRKGDSGERRAVSSMSADAPYRGGRDSWEEVGRMMGGPSRGQGSARAQPSADFGFSSLQDVSSSRGYSLPYSSDGGGSRERPFSSSMGLPSDPVFMQRRMGSPSNGKVQDFLGVMPPMFPHVCSLCDFDVHSTLEWNQHVNGLRHAENRRLLLNMYPEWDPSMSSGRSGNNMSAGLLGPSPMSSGQTGGMSRGWGAGPGLSGSNQPGQNKLRSRVVVVKYDRKPLSNKTLFSFTEPFGCLREHLVLKNKAFLEMSSHEEAQDVVNYYEQHPATLYGKPVSFYLSQRLVIQKDQPMSDRMDRPVREEGSKVVFFSNLPREDEKKKELLTIAGRFGTVEKHLFLTDQAFVQLGTVEDAEMLVKYYSVNPLTIKGRLIRLNVCTKYKTLNVNRRQGGSGGDNQGGRRSVRTNMAASSSGTRNTSSSSRTSSSKSRTREENTEEDKMKPEEKLVVETEEGSGGTEEEEEVLTDGNQEGEEHVKEEEVIDGNNVTEDTPGDVGGAEGESNKQGADPEIEPAETEASINNENENKGEVAESSEAVEGDLPNDEDFLENMEDFVTLDELDEDEDEDDSIDNTRRGGMRVVNIVGFRRGYNFLNELLGLAKPFGKVVKHLVLDLKPEAFLQFATEEEARAMAKFYNSNVMASVCGRAVRVNHSMNYPTIQCGSSRVVYVGQLPTTKFSDEAILKLAQPYGKVRKYFLNRIKRECFIEMDRAEDAEGMADACKAKPPKFNGKRLTVYVSRKYKQLKHGHRCPSKRLISPPAKSQQEPAAKKTREETGPEEEEEEREKKEDEGREEEEREKKEEEEEREKKEEEEEREKKEEEEREKKEEEEEEREKKEEEEDIQSCAVSSEETEEKIHQMSEDLQEEKQQEEEKVEDKEKMEASSSQNGLSEEPPRPPENKPGVASLPLPPYDADNPIGVEHVKMGYYCRVCFLFYSNEDTAKKTHCSSQAHYDKLQKYLEKEQTKAEKKKVKKSTA